MNDEKALTINENGIMPVEEFHSRMQKITQFLKKEMKQGPNGQGDYGVIDGTHGKKSLYKRGAEKLATLFGLVGDPEKISEVEDWEKGFLYYKYKCTLTHFATGKKVAAVTRSSNNKEKAFRSDNIYDAAAKVEAKAQKRAFVAAVVIATNASQLFDVENELDDEDESKSIAPNKSVSKEEDPGRNRLIMRLYGTAKEHGWNDNWIHAAIKKKWDKESLTEISNNQIEELTEFITITYQTVKPGERPLLRNAAPAPIHNSENIVDAEVKTETSPTKPESAMDGEVVSELPVDEKKKEPVCCRNAKKHGTEQVEVADPATSATPYFCDKECKEQYWSFVPKTKLDVLLERGRAKTKEAKEMGERLPEAFPDVDHPPVNMG